MNWVQGAHRCLLGLAASIIVAASAPASAQDISDSHLKVAREAITAIRTTDMFDAILPASASGLKQALIEKNPDMQQLITDTVDAKAIEMAARRADLEKEAALAYARVFTEAELTAIAAFYSSEAGNKLLDNGPIVTRELTKAADIWQRGVARDLAGEVGKILAASAQPAVPLPDAPVAAPAPEVPAAAPEEPAPAQ